jgi:hypothetical protein
MNKTIYVVGGYESTLMDMWEDEESDDPDSYVTPELPYNRIFVKKAPRTKYQIYHNAKAPASSMYAINVTTNKATAMPNPLPVDTILPALVTLSPTSVLIYGGISLETKTPIRQTYLLNTKTNQIREVGEIPGPGGYVVSQCINKNRLYSWWDTGMLTVMRIKTGTAKLVDFEGWVKIRGFIRVCSTTWEGRLGLGIKREISTYL